MDEPPFILNELPRNILARPGVGPFQYSIPPDTFFDDVDGFILTYVLVPLTTTWTNWLRYDEGTRTFFGVPTNADRGPYAFLLQATDSKNQVSPPIFFIINVPLDIRLEPDLVVTLLLEQPLVQKQTDAGTVVDGVGAGTQPSKRKEDDEERAGVIRARRADPACPAGSLVLDPLEREQVVEAAASYFEVDEASINVLGVTAQPATCRVAVTVSDNSISDCRDVQARQQQLEEDPTGLADAVSAVTQALVVADVSVRAQPCPDVELPTASGDKDEVVSGTVLPAAVIAAVLVLLVLVLMLLLRRRAHKEERGINTETFHARKPTVLDTDRRILANEFSRRDPALLLGDKEDYDDDDDFGSDSEFAAPPGYSGAARAVSARRGPYEAAPQYRPPPAYPFEGEAGAGSDRRDADGGRGGGHGRRSLCGAAGAG